MDAGGGLDHWIDAGVRSALEERFWAPISDTGSLEGLLPDPDFAASPGRHLGLFSDHSATHARDVAHRLVRLLDEHHGELFARRDDARFDFMRSLAVHLAFLHDVGMVDATRAGRRVHAQFAAQVPFNTSTDDLIGTIAEHRFLIGRLQTVAGDDPADRQLVVRELLAMSLCHSKSAVPAHRMIDPIELRRTMQVGVFAELGDLQVATQSGDWRSAPLPEPGTDPIAGRDRFHLRTGRAPFQWIDSDDEADRQLLDDVLDVVRMLRVADALRVRGRELRTSSGFEVFVDDSGMAVFHLATRDADISVDLRVESPMSVGEANMTATTVTHHGDLRISLHRGDFEPVAKEQVARACATVIIDIADDVLDAFPDRPDGRIQVERCADDPTFADDVCRLVAATSEYGERTAVVASLADCSEAERRRYLHARPLTSAESDEVVDRLARQGLRTSGIDLDRALDEVRIATVADGEVIIEVDDPATFVYVPISDGLLARPGGGFAPQEIAAWRRVGATAVLRRGRRNATVAATRSVDVVMIPGEVFVRDWFRPFTIDDLDEIEALVAGSSA